MSLMAFVLCGMRLSIHYLIYFVPPKTVFVLLKQTFLLIRPFVVILYVFDISNQLLMRVIPVLFTVVSVQIN